MMKQVKFKLPLRALTLASGLLLTASSFAQSGAIKGQVKDASGEPVMGATITVNGKAVGITDMDGNFSVDAAPGTNLTFTYLGMTPQTVKASNGMNITMTDDSKSLNEVVVIGYGAVKKSDLTGSVAAIKPDSKNKGVVINPEDMLAGKVAGVSVTSQSGEPGIASQIRVRGGSSLNASNNPLIVVDGIPMDNNSVGGTGSNVLAQINPQDIESFNILKDASATAIYGSRGSNGVIIITTKKGHKGQAPQVSYAGSVTLSMKKKTHDMMNGDQYREMVTNLFGEGSEQVNALGTADTDWQDLIYREAWSHDHNVTVSGSVKDVLPYRVSLGYTSQDGILKTSNYNRYTAAVNLNPSFFKDHLTLNINAKGMYSNSRKASNDAIGAAVSMDPTQDPYNFTSKRDLEMLGANKDQTLKNFGGYFEWLTSGATLKDNVWPYTKFSDATSNPLALLNLQNYKEKMKTFIGSADIDYKVHGFEDLRLHATLGLEFAKGSEDQNQPNSNPGNMYYGGITDNSKLKRDQLFSCYAQYYHDFNKDQHFDIMAGYEYQHSYFSYNNSWKQYYPETAGDNAGKLFKDGPDVDKFENYLVSFFGRANYILMNRYYLTATLRDDGSSRFKNHWGLFPSFAFAWKINDENEWKKIKWLSDLKLRLGYGVTGQQDGIDNYLWVPQYKKGQNFGRYPILGDGTIYTPKYYNEDLEWETTTTYNIGLDWGIFDQRLSGNVDWYYRKTTNLINNAPVASLSGFADSGIQNIGSLRNTGVEVALNWRAIQTKDWYWTISYNFTYNDNKITDLSGVSDTGKPVKAGDNIDQSNQVLAHQTGYAANSFYVYQQVYDKNGNPIENCVVDRNGDGKITDDDRYLYKNIMAPITMGLSSRLEYKNWDFSFSLRANIGNYVFNNFAQANRLTTGNSIWVQSAYMPNRPVNSLCWKSDNDASKMTDYFVQNASFLKCDNITLGYSFNNLFKSSSWKGIGGRVYATASNVFTITKYDGIDPEVYNGIDNNLYPRPISFILGVNLNF